MEPQDNRNAQPDEGDEGKDVGVNDGPSRDEENKGINAIVSVTEKLVPPDILGLTSSKIIDEKSVAKTTQVVNGLAADRAAKKIFEVDDEVPAVIRRAIEMQNQLEIQPGAVAIDGRLYPASLLRNSPSMEVQPGPISENTATTNAADLAGLAVANLVEDAEAAVTSDLPLAKDVDTQALRQGEEKTKQFKRCILLTFCLLIAILATLLALLVPTKEPHPDQTIQTKSPSHAPTSMHGYVLSLLPDDTILAIMDDSGSPQAKSYQWLMEDTEALADMPSKRIIQRLSLATLYFATNGGGWTVNTSWLDHSVHECQWYTKPDIAMQAAISQIYPGYLKDFFPPSEPPPTVCDNGGLYKHLWLDQNNLVGRIPEEIYMMTSLETFTIGYNHLEGTISNRVGQLTALQGLGIFSLRNGGTIPTQIGLLTQLRGLGLADNSHEGSLPSELLQLTKLDTLDLNTNPNLQGTIASEFGTFSKLRWLVLDESDFSGPIPTEIGLISTLELLGLDYNRYSGPIPSELGRLSQLQLVVIEGNDFDGTLPSQLGLLNNLLHLSVHENQIRGALPTQLGLLTNLYFSLNAASNNMSGSLPTELALLTKLEHLDLNNNAFTGAIPSEFGQLVVGHLSLATNSLSGKVPLELSALRRSLHTLQLEGNPMLSGVIPETLCSLHGTCIPRPSLYYSCPGQIEGTEFDCSNTLCGCACSCMDGG